MTFVAPGSRSAESQYLLKSRFIYFNKTKHKNKLFPGLLYKTLSKKREREREASKTKVKQFIVGAAA